MSEQSPTPSRPGWSLPVDPHELAIAEERARRRAEVESREDDGNDPPVVECSCYPVDPSLWTTHYGAVDPATTHEPNPDCRVHFTDEDRRQAELFVQAYRERDRFVSGDFDAATRANLAETLDRLNPIAPAEDVLGDAERTIQAFEDEAREVRQRNATIAGLRQWNEDAEDYLAQENPPLPQVLAIPEAEAGRLAVRADPPEIRFSDEVRKAAANAAWDVAEEKGVQYATISVCEAMTDAVLKVVLDAMGGRR